MAAPDKSTAVAQSTPVSSVQDAPKDKPVSWRHRLKRVLWDTFDYSPEERRFIFKIDFFILYGPEIECLIRANGRRTWASFSYFSKNLNQNNLC